MVYKLILLALSALTLFSCKKDKFSNEPEPEDQGVDTLSAGWSRVTAPREDYTDIFFSNADTGYLISLGTKIFKSTNGGITWTAMKPVGDNLINIAMANDGKAVFVSTKNKLYLTNDGSSIDSVLLADTGLSDAFFVSNTTAYAIGDKLWKTTNGGKEWTQVYDFGKYAEYRTLFFVNEMTGFVSANRNLYKTVDGGINWNKILNKNIYFMSFPSDAYGYASVYGQQVYQTSDEGQTWQPINSPAVASIWDLYFATPEIGFIHLGKEIYKTTNGGKMWERLVKLKSNEDVLAELHFIDENHGWACGGNGTVLRYVK
ncbi:MAG: WD40/YVTN/BNR-like repeat-containing protein [Agriterribacter sp.]